MENQKKHERNLELMRKRDKNKKLWSFSALGKFYGIKTSTAFEIYHREKARQRMRNHKRVNTPPSIAGKYSFIAEKVDAQKPVV